MYNSQCEFCITILNNFERKMDLYTKNGNVRNLPSVRQLQCFLAVAQELNFRKASIRLNMTQPPLTRQIKCLESLLGQRLFFRNTHEVYLTDMGNTFLKKAENILNEISLLVEESSISSERIRIGYTRILNFENIPELISKYDMKQKSVIENLTSNELLQNLINNNLDIVFTGEKGFVREDEVHFKWVYREALQLVIPTSHKSSTYETLSLEDVADLPLFWFSRNSNPTYYDKCEEYLSNLPFNLKREQEPNDSLVMLSKISKGKGMALMPKSLCTVQQEEFTYKTLSSEANNHLNINVYAAIRKNESRQEILSFLEDI